MLRKKRPQRDLQLRAKRTQNNRFLRETLPRKANRPHPYPLPLAMPHPGRRNRPAIRTPWPVSRLQCPRLGCPVSRDEIAKGLYS